MINRQDYLRQKAKLIKALNDDWTFKAMSQAIDLNYHSFMNWLHGYYQFSYGKERELKSLLSDLE